MVSQNSRQGPTQNMNKIDKKGLSMFSRIIFVFLTALTFFWLSDEVQAASVCGGINANGTLQPACKSKPGKLLGAPVLACPKGQIYDLEACWQCPPGYGRTADAIDTKTACSRVSNKDVFGDVTRATKIPGSGICPSGSFYDGYNGGGCWSCPRGYRRTIFPVYEDKACETGDIFSGIKWVPAQFQSASCGAANAVFDLGACWSCPSGYVRTIFPVNAKNACGRPLIETQPAKKIKNAGCKAYGADAFWDPKATKGTVIGSCWSCPTDYKRSMAPVDSQAACSAPVMEWQMSTFPEKGLFRLDGAVEVAAIVIKERKELERVAIALGKSAGLSPAQSVDLLWDEIAQYPEHNMALRHVVLSHILDLALDKKTLSPSSPEGRLVKSFETYIKGHKIYLAKEALTAYDNWHLTQKTILERRQRENSKHLRSNMHILFTDQMPMPPDFRKIVSRSAMVSMAGALPTLGLFTTNIIPFDAEDSVADVLMKKIFVNRTDTSFADDIIDETATNTKKILGNSDEIAKVSKQFVGNLDDVVKNAGKAVKGLKSAVSAGKILKNLASFTGVGLAVEMFVTVLEAELTANIEKADARPKLERYLWAAQNYKSNLRSMSQDPAEAAKIFTYWALATTGDAKPDAAGMRKIAKAAADISADRELKTDHLAFERSNGKWFNVNGRGVDISVGTSEGIWHVSANGTVYWADALKDRNWSKMPLENVAQIAAMPAKKEAFVLKKDGSMAVFARNKLRNIAGWAADIAVGADGQKWHIGGNNSLYLMGKGSQWQRVQGPKAVKIAAGPGDLAWVIDTQNYLHYHLSGRWTKMNKQAKDLAVGPDAALWIAGLDEQVYRLTHNSQWKEARGGHVDRLAAGPLGSLWGLRPDNTIVLYQHKSTKNYPLAQKGYFKDTSQTTTGGGDIEITPIIIDDPVITTYVDKHFTKKKKKWRDVSGFASQISTGSSGDVWHIGGKGTLYVQPAGKTGWQSIGLTGIKEVRADRLQGKAFVLDDKGNMWDVKANGRKHQIPGWASDIAIDDQGTRWHIGGNNSVYRMSDNGWKRVPGALSKIEGGKNAQVWAIGMRNEIYRFEKGKWVQLPGVAYDLAVGADGSIWHIGGNNTLYRMTEKGWELVDDKKAISLSIGAKGDVWIVKPNKRMEVYR